MTTSLPTVTITDLSRRLGSFLVRVKQGPILVTALGKPVAVLMSPDLWESMNAEIDRLNDQVEGRSGNV